MLASGESVAGAVAGGVDGVEQAVRAGRNETAAAAAGRRRRRRKERERSMHFMTDTYVPGARAIYEIAETRVPGYVQSRFPALTDFATLVLLVIRANHREFRGTRRFELRSRVGEGAVGVVYEAVDRESNARIALKTLRELSPEAILLLKSEFRAVQDLHHPNLVRLGELFEEEGSWFFTMEFVKGTDFLRYVRPEEAQDGRRAALGFDEARLRDALVQL